MRSDIEHRIGALAREQHGVVTSVQLVGLGLLPGAIQRRAASGQLQRMFRGVYVVGPLMPPQAPEMAAVLACGFSALLSYRSAAVLWVNARREAALDVCVVGKHNGQHAGIHVRRIKQLDPDERTTREWIPITTPGRTLVDFAAVASIRELEQAIAQAERDQLVTPAELVALSERHAGRRGVRALRAVRATFGGPALTRSEAEFRLLALVRKARLPAPQVNVVVAGREIDFFWQSERIGVEVDGYRYQDRKSVV